MDSSFFLQNLPYSAAVGVVKKLKTSEFVKSMRTCTWIKNMIDARRHTFVKDALNMDLAVYINDVRGKDDQTIREKLIGDMAHFKVAMISITGFESDIAELQRLLGLIREAGVYTDYLHLDRTVTLPEMFVQFRPKHYSVNVYRNQTCQIANEVFPPNGMETIRVQINQEPAMTQMIQFLIGRSRELTVISHLEFKLSIMKQLMMTVAEKGRDQEINISLTKPFIRIGPHVFDEPFHETDFGLDHRVFSIGRKYRIVGFHLFILRCPTGAVFAALEGKEECDDLYEPFFCIQAANLAEFQTRFVNNFSYLKRSLVNRLMVTSFVKQYFNEEL